MLTTSWSLQCGGSARLNCSDEIFGSRLRGTSANGDRGRIKFAGTIRASGSRKGRASLAYVRSLSRKGLKPELQDQRVSSRSVPADVDQRLHVIPYSDLVLRRKLDGGLSLIEDEYCWEDAWNVYMHESQTATLKELAARVQECNVGPQVVDNEAIDDDEIDQQARSEPDVVQGPSFFSKLRSKQLGRRRARGLLLLNVLAALYGSSTVAGKFATDVAPGLPASLSTLVRFSSALLVFLPALRNVLGRRHRNPALLKAGAELGALLFAAAVVETCGDGGASSDAPLLFAFTVIFVPIMELCAGRRSVRNITRIASLVALSGMGVLEEEGVGWKGISLPQVGDVWGLAASAIYALHIFRSETHSKSSFKPFELTAIQCGTVASLSLVWELVRLLHSNTSAMEYVSQLQALPWSPLVYTGLVCSGLCSWLEIHGLRSVQASTATMVNTTIPIWGAFLSFLLRGDTLDDSAIVGGLVILVASFFAQLISKEADEPRTEDEEPRSTVKGDHVQGAIITSQLKFPYYAAQAKRLLVDAKMKLLSVKSLVMSTLLTTTTTGTAPPGAPPLHSAIATSVTLQQVTSNSGSSPGALIDIATGLLESAITALGSDLLQTMDEAEDMAKLLEQAAQTAVDHAATAASSIANWTVVDSTTTTALVDNSLDCALPLIAHNADTVVHALLICSSHSN